MGTKFYIVCFAVCVLSIGCTEEDVVADAPTASEKEATTPVQNLVASGISVNHSYSDSYISSGFSFLSPDQLDKNRQAIGGSSYTEVYGFNVPEANRARGIRWNSGDETTASWRPQGIAGFKKNGIRYLLITWYARNASDYKGSRITLLDISPSSSTYLMYRHILLVHDVIPSSVSGYTQYGSYAPLNLHAGGVAYFNDKIYIASTNLGMRVFDLNKIVEVSTGSSTSTKCGQDSGGNLYAFNYRYILPQMEYYDINGGANPFSTIQLNEEGNEFWTAQYSHGSASSSVVPKIYGFPIDSNGTVLNSGIEYFIPKNSLFADDHAHGMQGIFRKGSRTWLSCTGSPSSSYGSTARLARYTDGASNTVRYRWPYGAESLYYEKQYDYLWSLTEYEPNSGAANGSQVNRCIFAVHFSNYE
ncbi:MULTISPECIES: hypothetical protein [unclassified Arenibacter]|uniref:hypothetical protein n=1 Tax=unclassified Arenibacter TaxID=2615047 RepID=UPI000E355913|nr:MULTISPECIES: hypothetical protein [unclassified Arenibacter]MCM4162334.1 hypothetical protein [Arenibacter sp. A80]RFT57932.1 hypothetical protein D0S24_01870 [Arenibacter sp. P308M17]